MAISASGQSNEKRNGRPPTGGAQTAERSAAAFTPTYYYEFVRPGFVYSHVKIEHDDSGRGTIAFKRDGAEGFVDDPISLTPATMERLQAAYRALNFLESTESYQTKMDHSNMGNITLIERRSGRERKAEFNWTENKDAKVLMDLYRAISNEYTWKFELLAARENQPLLTPGLIEILERYVQRGEIPDPPHLIPFLTELSVDERLPLMARNRAAKLVKSLGRTAK